MLPSLRVIADRQAGVFSRAQALVAGHTPGEIDMMLRSRRWSRVRHGVYQDSEPANAHELHLRRCWGALLVAGPRNVIAGPSAALVRGLALVDPPAAVHVVGASARSAAGIRVIRRQIGVEADDLGGLPVTPLVQTVVDCATLLPYEAAVVLADSALRTGEVERTEILDVAERCAAPARVRRAVTFADGRSESVGESLARVAIAAAGLPPPNLQEEFLARGRRYRVDFYWPEHRTIGEFDGRVKYGDDPQVLWREKRREDDLRSEGYGFARFSASDVRRPRELASVVRTAFGNARRAA
jgi:hypothetical protein